MEEFQMRATKLLPQIKDLSYLERLIRTLDLPSLKYRRLRACEVIWWKRTKLSQTSKLVM